MSPDPVRFVAVVLAVVLTTGCGTSLEERRPDESFARATHEFVVFLPRKPRAEPRVAVSEAELREAMQWLLTDVRTEELRAEWRRIASDARFHPLRAEGPQRPYRLMLASWNSRNPALEEITKGYQQWCSPRTRRAQCIPIPPDRVNLNDAEVYQVAFDFAMGAQWDGFTHELKGMIQPSSLRVVLLTGLVVFMACLAIPELTTKIPVAIATAVLTAYLGAQAVCELVFGWFRMVREVDTATTFEQVRAAGERYGERIGAETARILVMLAMAAVAEGGVIASLMKLPQVGAASAALAADTGGMGLESITQVSGAKVLQGGVSITVEGVAQGTLGVAMAGRGGAPKVGTVLSPKPPQKPVDIRLTYNKDWTLQQRAEARVKLRKLNSATSRIVVEKPSRAPTSASARWKARGNTVPPGCDVDHCVDLQLGGEDTLENMWPLDSSVNRSLGVKIHHAIKDLPPGTPIGKITIE